MRLDAPGAMNMPASRRPCYRAGTVRRDRPHMRIAALIALLLGSLALQNVPDEGTSVTYAPKPGAGKGRQIVLLAGDEEYRSEEALPMLAKILSQRHGFRTTVLFSVDPDGTINPKNGRSLSNPG